MFSAQHADQIIRGFDKNIYSGESVASLVEHLVIFNQSN